MIEMPLSPTFAIKPQPSAINSSSMIAVRALAKKIGEQEILRGVDLEVRTGETLAIIGRSGGGQKDLLKDLLGVREPDAGGILVDGQNIIGMNQRQLRTNRENGGRLFHGGALFDLQTEG